MKQILPALLALLALSGAGAAGQEPVSILGRVYDAATGAPIEGAVVELAGSGFGAVTNAEGAFRLRGVLPGAHRIQVRHLAYGTLGQDVEVPPDKDLALELRLSAQALELEPIDVEVLRPVETATTRSNVITRDQIEEVAGRVRHIGDLVRARIPGATVSESRGGYLCLEFRGARNSRTTGCNFPRIILDGLPVTDPARFLRDLQVEDLERVEFIPASEAGARYGMETTYGVLLIETRRSGLAESLREPEAPRYLAYQWSREEGGHPTLRSLGGATLGGVLGTVAGLAALGCTPGSDSSGTACVRDAGTGRGTAAALLPLLGSSLGARAFGVTPGSRGRLLPSLAVTALPALMGYAVYSESAKSDFRGQMWLGTGLVLVATPLVATLADKLFRNAR